MNEKDLDKEIQRMDGMNIYQRINKVMQEVEYLKKDQQIKIKTKSGAEFSYNAITHDAVTAAIRGAMVDNGIATRISKQKVTILSDVRCLVEIVVTLVNIDNPEDCFDVYGAAFGDDYGDKAIGKAISMSVKYVYLKTLLLETGENEEGRLAQRTPYTQEQKEAYYQYIESDDSLGLFLFTQRVDGEVNIALFNSFPKGAKSKMKENVRKMESIGGDINEAATEAIKNDDQLGLMECMDGAAGKTAKIFRSRLSAEDQSKFDKLFTGE